MAHNTRGYFVPFEEDENQPTVDIINAAKSNDNIEKSHYPADIAGELEGMVPEVIGDKILATAWEYARSVIPVFTNWERYLAFVRVVVIGFMTEFNGERVERSIQDNVEGTCLNYDINELHAILFGNTEGEDIIMEQFKTCQLFGLEKNCGRQDGEIFQHYLKSIASGCPETWFSARDADALITWTLVAALRCNDIEDFPSADVLGPLADISMVLYDANAFYKHQVEGEVHNTFAYIGEEARVDAVRHSREAFWALDVALSPYPAGQILLNTVRGLASSVPIMMRRYRFVEDGLTLGLPIEDSAAEHDLNHSKLWGQPFFPVYAPSRPAVEPELPIEWPFWINDNVLIPDLSYCFLSAENDSFCPDCQPPQPHDYYMKTIEDMPFRGYTLCDKCRQRWISHIAKIHQRAEACIKEVQQFGFRRRDNVLATYY